MILPKRAFPVFESLKTNAEFECVDEGMTLRDYFAGQALAGTIAARLLDYSRDSPKHFAQAAYQIADAMLEAREKKEP